MATADDVFSETCGTRRALELLADKWTVLLVAALTPGPRRNGELQRQLEGISAKVLADSLRSLERDGLVTRTVYPEVPPRVEYALTPLGQTLSEPIRALCHWAAAHYAEVQAARDRWVARGAPRGREPRAEGASANPRERARARGDE